MARPKNDQPTPGEFAILKILWQHGPMTVRQVMAILNQQRSRAYTSVMSLLNVMTDKGLVKRQPQGRAFVYHATASRRKTLAEMAKDLVGRAFEGSLSALVAHLLERSPPDPRELEAVRETIDEYLRQQGGS